VDQRTFYRDLETLRRLGITVVQEGSHYRLETELAETLQRLPLPDPKLTIAEAQILARGRTAAHRKLARFLREVLGATRA
jgi:predicted DNA-binding transcriptional regulator YafY